MASINLLIGLTLPGFEPMISHTRGQCSTNSATAPGAQLKDWPSRLLLCWPWDPFDLYMPVLTANLPLGD